MRTLDTPIPKGGAVVWRTVVKDGKRYTLQVFVRPAELERLVAEQIDEHRNGTSETVAGPLSITLTRQS